ncbi:MULTISPECIES: DUF2318 domain-containing protein [unclassified Pseudodesulfovibrio]|uniref:DUF2318 domain-containing protein n=1 Tax=unclassified Pseudodesulfovibrio TaxID=2661612 RepID=UPI000FEB8CD4|nr:MULTISPECIES: DUF2318 domain-containing protein [unclassified Pseudodesulfovibrio]MCJ2166168.1 DUF2318 domain-containing protein [Pseudodesulfovibrio sp. S3-i]RWU02365.1 DUF2318 domain-containing protein [Pseudodesulfovibrio sp. S3]
MKGIKYISILAMLFTMVMVAEGGAFFGFGQTDSFKVENGKAVFALADVSDGKAHYYSHEVDGKDVKFFLLKSSDGVIRAAFDACDVCYLEKKGYSQAGDFMVCNNCGQRFHSSRINEVEGGCNPSPLNRTIEGGNVVIKVSDIRDGLRYF